jgi:hypothetical protein
MKPVDRQAIRSLSDRLQLSDSNPRRVGFTELPAIIVRLSLLEIDGVKIERAEDPAWNDWTMARPSVIDSLDAFDPGIVNELGWSMWRRLSNARPKSQRAS